MFQGSVAKSRIWAQVSRPWGPHVVAHSQGEVSLVGEDTVSGLRVLRACLLALFRGEGRAQILQAGLSHGEGEGASPPSGLGWWREETELSLPGWAAAREGFCLLFHLPPCHSAHPPLTVQGTAQ